MSSTTVYLIDKGDVFTQDGLGPFDLRWINSRMIISFNINDLANVPRNEKTVQNNDALWIAIRTLFQNQRRFTIRTLFHDTSRGRGMSIRVSGPFLEKLKGVYDDFNSLKLNLNLSHQNKSWSIDIGLNNFRRQGGVLRIVHSERSERLFRRIAALPDLKLSLKLTTRVHVLHTRRLMSRKLVADKIPYNFHLISENGTRIGCHKELLAAHSNVFSCPSVQSMDGFKLFVADDLLLILKNYLYAETLKDITRDQQTSFELLEAAHFYNIAGLERIMKKKLIAMLDVQGNVGLDLAIFLYSFAKKVEVGYEELGAKALALIQNTSRSEIEKSEAFQFITKNDEKFGEVVRSLGFIRPAEE